ncbi:hypothetical protein MAR_035160, partial [Mya arenaria]
MRKHGIVFFMNHPKCAKGHDHLLINNCFYCSLMIPLILLAGKRNQIRVLQSATITGLFLFEGFEGISNDLTVNSVLFARGYICKDCYESNKKLLGVPTKPITSKEDVKAGDIIRFDYKNCFHEAIILEINHTEKYSMVCQISHYQLGYFPRHTVQEEDKTIPFDGSYSVLQYDRPEFETYSPEQVIERARRRRGEQDFQYYLNDAGHFVRSCKLKICS